MRVLNLITVLATLRDKNLRALYGVAISWVLWVLVALHVGLRVLPPGYDTLCQRMDAIDSVVASIAMVLFLYGIFGVQYEEDGCIERWIDRATIARS